MSNQTRKTPTGENTGRWTKEEHGAFLDGLRQHGKEWKKIAAMIETRTVVQIRTHAQKYFQKLAKTRESQGKEVPGDLVSTASNPRHYAETKNRRSSTSSSRRVAPTKKPSILPSSNNMTSLPLKVLSANPLVPEPKPVRGMALDLDDKAIEAVTKRPSVVTGLHKPSTATSSAPSLVRPPIDSNNKHTPFAVSHREERTMPSKKRDDSQNNKVSLDITPATPKAADAPRLTISTDLINSPYIGGLMSELSENDVMIMKSRDEEDLKWLVSMSSRLPDASPTAVSDFEFYRDFETDDDNILFPPMSPSAEEGMDPVSPESQITLNRGHSDKAVHPVEDSASSAADLGMSEAQSIEEWISSSEGSKSIDGDSDFLSVHDCDDLDHSAELTEMGGPFTKYVFGDDPEADLEPQFKRRKLSIEA